MRQIFDKDLLHCLKNIIYCLYLFIKSCSLGTLGRILLFYFNFKPLFLLTNNTFYHITFFYIAWGSVISYYIAYNIKACGIFNHISYIDIIEYLSVLHFYQITFCLMCRKSAILFQLNVVFHHATWNNNKKYKIIKIIQKHETKKQKHPKAYSIVDHMSYMV